MSAHAKFGPSGYNGWSQCSEWASDPTPSKWAAAGTLAHEVAAALLLGEKTPNVGIDVLRDMQDYADWVNGQCTGSTEKHVELAMDISWMTGEEDAKGTADAVLVDYERRSITVIDLKTGRKRVNAKDNGQLQMYAAAAVSLFTEMHRLIDDTQPNPFDTVHTIIYQPMLDHIDQWSISVGELMGWAQAIRPAKTIRAGTKQCQWCMKKAECESFARWVNVKVDQTNIDDRQNLRAATLADAYGSVDAIRGWCSAVEEAAKQLLVDGQDLPGYKLVQGSRGSRKWTDTGEVENLLKHMRLKREVMYKTDLITPTTAERLLKSKTLNSNQWSQLQELITRDGTALKVVPETDKRPGASEVTVAFKSLGQTVE